MGSRPRLVAESFPMLPGALNTQEISRMALPRHSAWTPVRSQQLALRRAKIASSGNVDLKAMRHGNPLGSLK